MKVDIPPKWNFTWESVFELITSIAIVTPEMHVCSWLGISLVVGHDGWINITMSWNLLGLIPCDSDYWTIILMMPNNSLPDF